MASPCIWVIEFSQFAVLCSHLSETYLSLQLEQAVFRLEMEWDCSLHRHRVVSVKERWTCQEDLSEQVPRIEVVLDELRKRSMISFHKQLHDQGVAPLAC